MQSLADSGLSEVTDQLTEPKKIATIFIVIPSLPGAENDAAALSSPSSESLPDSEPEHISTGTK